MHSAHRCPLIKPHFFSDFIRPRLTTVEEELDRIGEIAMENLYQIIHRDPKKIANVELTPGVIVRDSTRSKIKICLSLRSSRFCHAVQECYKVPLTKTSALTLGLMS